MEKCILYLVTLPLKQHLSKERRVMVRKRIFVIFLTMILLFAFTPVMTYANSTNATNTKAIYLSEQQIGPLWVYQFEISRIRYCPYNATIEESIFVTVASGYYNSRGEPIMASGYLYIDTIVYGFPTADQKTIEYKGLVTAYI